MKVSVVICTYDEGIYEHLCEAVESVRSQSYDGVETIVVVDGNQKLCEQVETDYGDAADVKIHCNEENRGLSASRNNGIERATGDVIAFMDDDAVADDNWVEELVDIYENRDAIAVGGKMTPIWVAGEPEFLPEEFYWLIGVTHRGFAESGEEVRNTFGSNISFRADVLEELEGFAIEIGRQGEKNLQTEEAELGARMREEYGEGVIYNPDAKVGHKIFEWRTDKRWLIERAFWQGYSKRAMETLVDDESGGEESAYLRQLLVEFIPARVKSLVIGPNSTEAKQLLMLFVLTGVVGLGYVYGLLRW
jgi:glycosyltransferase involved in cell wall biosynthesis